MVSASGIRAGRAYVEIGSDDSLLRSGLAKAQSLVRDFGRQAARIAVVASAAIAVAMGMATKAFADFEYQMAKVSTMVSNTDKYMGEFGSGIKKMAVEFGQSTETLTNGLYQLLSAQVPAADAMDALRTVTKGAVGGFTEVGNSATAMVRIMRSYGLTAADAAEISDTLFTIVEKGVINYEELAENIGKVAPTAKAAGLSLDQMAAAVATVLTIEDPARAMMRLRAALVLAAKSGEDLWTFVEKFRGADLGDILDAGIPQKAADGVLILASNYDLLQSNLDAMADKSGAAETAYKKMASTLTIYFNRIKQVGIVTLIEMGKVLVDSTDKIIPAFIKTVANLGKMVLTVTKMIAGFVKSHQTLIKVAAIVVGGLTAAAVAFVAVAGGAALAALAVMGLNAALIALTAHPIVAFISLVAAAIVGLAVAIGIAGVKMAEFDMDIEKTLADADKLKKELKELEAIQAKGVKLGAVKSAEKTESKERLKRERQALLDLERARIKSIENTYTRERTLLNVSFREKMAEMRAVGNTQRAIDAKNIEWNQALENLNTEYTKKRNEDAVQHRRDLERAAEREALEAQRKLEAVEAGNNAILLDAERLQLQLKFKGNELKFKELELDKKIALQRAKAAGLDLENIKKLFNLRKELLQMDAAAALKGAVRGTFMATNALSLSIPKIDNGAKQLDELRNISASNKEIAKNTKGGGSTALMYY